MLPFSIWLCLLLALGYVLGAFVYGPLGITGNWLIVASITVGVVLTMLGRHFRIVSIYWWRREP